MKNREELDVDEVRPEVWKRIEAQLPNPASQNFFSKYPYLKVAAIVLLSFVVSYGIFQYRHKTDLRQAAVDISHSLGVERPSVWEPELEEMESYYQMEVSRKLDKLGSYDLKAYPFAYQFLEELNHAESSYLDLKKDMIQDGYNEHIIQGMIATYEQKIKILEQLFQHIQQSKTEAQPTSDGFEKL